MSGLIPQSFIDELIARSEIVELVENYIPLKKRGNSYLACCPFHNEKSPSFNVIAKKQFYHCFGCGASGNVISFIMQYLNQDFVEAIETLATRAGMQVPNEKRNASSQHMVSLYQTLEKVNAYYQQQLKQVPEAISYLKDRGLDGRIAKQYQIGYAPAGWHTLSNQFKSNHQALITSGMLIQKDNGQTYDRYRHRIMFPIHDRRGKIIGFGGRSLDKDQQPKYLNSPETPIFQKNRELYGLYQVIESSKKLDFIVVVEGYLDVIALAQYGITHVVAALGTAINTYHIQILNKYTPKIIFCFDGDHAGHEAAWRALENSLSLLNENLNINFVFLPAEHDPDSYVRENGADAFLKLIQHATPIHHFFIQRLSNNINLHELAGRNQFMSATKPYLQQIPNGAFRELLFNEISRLTHIENHRIDDIIKKPDEKSNSEITTTSSAHQIHRIQRSPTRLILAILLQNPEQYSKHITLLQNIQLEGEADVVFKLLTQIISQNPAISPAMIIENCREHPSFTHLSKLALWDHQIPDEKIDEELIDIVNFIQKQQLEREIANYITKSRIEGLTDEERIALQTRLRQRHQPNTLDQT